MMKKLMMTAALASATLSVQAANCSSDGCCSSFMDDVCCGSVEVFGHALYWQPSGCNSQYVVTDDTFFTRVNNLIPNQNNPVPIGEERGKCPDYDWGFRLGIGYISGDGCMDARLTYSRLHTTDHQRVTPETTQVLWPSFGPSGILVIAAVPDPNRSVFAQPGGIPGLTDPGLEAYATQRQHNDWDAVDVEVGSRNMQGCNLRLRSAIGLSWTEIDYSKEVHYQGTLANSVNGDVFTATTDVYASSKTWGVGPRVSSDARYDIACGFGLTGKVGMAIYGGEIRQRQNGELVVTETNVPPATTVFSVGGKARCHLFPEWDAALGLDYEWCCGCCRINIEAGYEFRTYRTAIGMNYFTDDNTANNAAVCDPFNLQGLYFGGRVQF